MSKYAEKITALTENDTMADEDLISLGNGGTASLRKITWANIIKSIKSKLGMGDTSLSGIGDGTVTGAISQLNTKTGSKSLSGIGDGTVTGAIIQIRDSVKNAIAGIFSGDVSAKGALTASTVKVNYKYWFTDAYTQDKAITAIWKDGVGHDLCHIDADGLTCYYGWAGTASYATTTVIRGRTVQAKNASGTSSLSDERLKHGFKSLDEFDEVYMDIDPCAFQYNSGSSGRYHFGAKAQDVKRAFEAHGYTTQDFGGIVQSYDNPENEDYCGVLDPWSLIYTEFTMWNMHMVQKALKEIESLKKQLNAQ